MYVCIIIISAVYEIKHAAAACIISSKCAVRIIQQKSAAL